MTQPPPVPRSSQVAVQNAGSTGFLSSVGLRVDSEAALVERLATPGLKLVEAYSEPWGPCGSVGTMLKTFLLQENPAEGALEVLVCKAEGNSLLEKCRATSVPHFFFFRNGVLRDTVTYPNVPALEAALRAHLPKAGEAPDDPALNKFTVITQPAARPTTASRPRTADLLRRSSVAVPSMGAAAALHRPSMVTAGPAVAEEDS